MRDIVNCIRLSMLEARTAEQDFLQQDLVNIDFYKGHPTTPLARHQAAMASLRTETENLIRLSSPAEVHTHQQLLEMANQYAADFAQLVTAFRERGFKEWGLEGSWRKAMLDVEGYIERTQNAFAVRALLDLKCDKKDHLVRNETVFIAAIYDDIKQLIRMVNEQITPATDTILNVLEEYRVKFTNYVSIQEQIGNNQNEGLQGRMHQAVQAIEPVITEAHEKAVRLHDHARRDFLSIISHIWLGGLGVVGVFFYLHANSITLPITQLKDAALRIGKGDLNTRIAVNSHDEIGVLANAFNQMTLDLQKTQEALRESEHYSRLIIETANDAFVDIDAQGFITDWNQQAETIFGWSRHEAGGRRLDETIIPAKYRQLHIQGHQHFLNTGEGPVFNKRVELVALHRQG